MNRNQIQAFAATSLALTLIIGVSRCSPIANSIDKFGRPRSATPIDVPAPMDVVLQQRPQPAPPVARSFPAVVLPFDQYQKEIRKLPKVQSLNLLMDGVEGSPDTPHSRESNESYDALNEFRRNRAIHLNISGDGPDECRAYIGVALSAIKIEAYELSPLATECKRNADGTWTFAVASSVSTATWDAIEGSLQGLTLYVTSHPSIALAPLPSPSPKASPPAISVLPTPTANSR